MMKQAFPGELWLKAHVRKEQKIRRVYIGQLNIYRVEDFVYSGDIFKSFGNKKFSYVNRELLQFPHCSGTFAR